VAPDPGQAAGRARRSRRRPARRQDRQVLEDRPQVKKLRVLGNQRIAAGGTVKRARKRATSVKKTAAG
jgi:hypothetical protein